MPFAAAAPIIGGALSAGGAIGAAEIGKSGGPSAPKTAGDLLNIYNWALPQGQQQFPKGNEILNQGLGTIQGALGPLGGAEDYFRQLLGADRNTIGQLSAPAINATVDQANAQRAAAERFGTARVGGAAAADRNLGAQTTGQIGNIVNQTAQNARLTGAQGLEQTAQERLAIGQGEAGVGNSFLTEGQNLLNTAQSSAAQAGGLAVQNSALQFQQQQALGQGIGNLLSSIFLGGGSQPQQPAPAAQAPANPNSWESILINNGAPPDISGQIPVDLSNPAIFGGGG